MGLQGKGRKLAVSVRLGYPLNNMASERVAHLEIGDETANVLLLELDLNAEQLMALMAHSTAYVDAWMPVRLDHIGKQMQHGSLHLGRDLSETKARELAEDWRVTEGWETVDVRRDNTSRWNVTGRRWVEVKEESDE